MALEAAPTDQGIAPANDLAAGRLARPLQEAVPQAFAYRLMSLSPGADSARVKAFPEQVFAALDA